jgi:hypothetical protein
MLPIQFIVRRLRLLRSSNHAENFEPVAVTRVFGERTRRCREPSCCWAGVEEVRPALLGSNQPRNVYFYINLMNRDLTSHGITGAPSIGNPTLVFTAKPTVSPARIMAVSGTFHASEALRPHRRSVSDGSTTGMM